jgi:hypothetical protein
MPTENLGYQLIGVQHTFADGGTALFYERGMVIKTAAGESEVSFNFPLIGRPHIATPGAAFELGAISFTNGAIGSLVLEALVGRVGLMPSGSFPALPLSFGPIQTDNSEGVVTYVVPASASLQERQLYDVVFRDYQNSWHVVAPNAVYYRSSWHDFGIAHITDVHVARRIDSFRGILLERGLTESAQNLTNWNDRFRGFVRYANYMHDIGVLDVIVATGDLIDYIYETGDQEAGTNNAVFLRNLILGQAPGPEFQDVERLRVPIFMVPGNHDYRLHPYRIIFDLDGGPLNLKHIRNYSGYNILKQDAIALSVASGDSLEIPEVSADNAEQMVVIDPEPPWLDFLIPRGSYVVQLGDHRIVMINSSHDLDILHGKFEALLVRFTEQEEDAETFVGGSPNCEGVDGNAFELATSTLAQTSGLFILGIHSPLLNVWDNSYPYFLRESQRPAQQRQVECFLLYHKKGLIPPWQNLSEYVQGQHPAWFGQVNGDTAFVKRGDTDDLLDFGVARGRSEDLLQVLAGVGSPRKADVVLAGHIHSHNEFRLEIDPATGDVVYYMDFYTSNPQRYYPSRFFTGETHFAPPDDISLPHSEPDSDIAYVEVTSDAERNVYPWPAPFEANYKYTVSVPAYWDPLDRTADARAWWVSHRPLVLQTSSLGPLDKTTGPSFTGFRFLSVRNDVIEKIHFIPTARLEQNNYQLAWEEAIKPEPERRYKYIERSRYFNIPKAVSWPASVALASGETKTVYRDGDGILWELWAQPDGTVGYRKLTEEAQAASASSDTSIFLHHQAQTPIALHRGDDGHVHSIYWTPDGIGSDRLSASAGAPEAATGTVPCGHYAPAEDTTYVVYRGTDDNIHTLNWFGDDAANYDGEYIKADEGWPLAQGNPSSYVDADDKNRINYRGTDNEIHSLYWRPSDAVGLDNLSAVAQAPLTAGDPVGYFIPSHTYGENFANVAYSVHQVTYRSVDGDIIELWWVGEDVVRYGNLTQLSNGPKAVADPVAYYDPATVTKHVFYYAEDGHMHELWWYPGTTYPQDVDITVGALAPPAAKARPSAFVTQNPTRHHVVYTGTDHQIHEIHWS